MTSAATRRPGRIEMGWLLAGAGAILLLVSLFLDWFEPGLEAWVVFEVLDLVLAAAALAVLAVVARSSGFQGLDERAGTAAAIAAAVVVVSQLINHPPAAADLDVGIGGWLALAGAALMVVGAMIRRAGVSVAVVREEPGTPRTSPETKTEPMRPDQPR